MVKYLKTLLLVPSYHNCCSNKHLQFRNSLDISGVTCKYLCICSNYVNYVILHYKQSSLYAD